MRRGDGVSLKENIEMVKDELNSEEKFFESAVKTERFVKKYKNLLIASVVAVIVLVVVLAVYDATQRSRIADANEAFALLQKDANNSEAAARLKEKAPELYDVWALSNAVKNADEEALKTLSTSKAIAVSDIATYELAAMQRDVKKLDEYAYGQNAIYRDLALIESAVLLLQKSDIDAAHAKLKMLTPDSAMYKVAQMLLHYGVK